MSQFVQREKDGLVYMVSGLIPAKHAFTTRYGGVSGGYLASLNLGFNRGDERGHVMENYRILGRTLGIDVMSAAYTKQVHGVHVRLVTDADRCGPTDPAPCDADGLVTNVKGLPIFCFTADWRAAAAARPRARDRRAPSTAAGAAPSETSLLWRCV